jgi:hypothetical protein
MTVERAHRILGQGYTREEARRLVAACGLLLDAAESAFRSEQLPTAGDGQASAREPVFRVAPGASAQRVSESRTDGPVSVPAEAVGVPNPCEP